MTTFSQHSIAAGNNVALASLNLIERIKPGGDQYYYVAPQVIPHGSPGARIARLNGLSYRHGYPYVDWLFSVMTRLQYEYMKTTYCAGGYSGLVTVYTTVSSMTYVRYNAVLDVPETEAIADGFYAFQKIPIRLSHLVAI
jgi:hypothetical protein